MSGFWQISVVVPASSDQRSVTRAGSSVGGRVHLCCGDPERSSYLCRLMTPHNYHLRCPSLLIMDLYKQMSLLIVNLASLAFPIYHIDIRLIEDLSCARDKSSLGVNLNCLQIDLELPRKGQHLILLYPRIYPDLDSVLLIELHYPL